MISNAPAPDPNLAVALRLITRALVRLGGESSPQAAHCETQARAAHQALSAAPQDVSARHTALSTDQTEFEQRESRSTDNPAALLADAEKLVGGLPGRLRNQVAVCAAMTYLRRARRALDL